MQALALQNYHTISQKNRYLIFLVISEFILGFMMMFRVQQKKYLYLVGSFNFGGVCCPDVTLLIVVITQCLSSNGIVMASFELIYQFLHQPSAFIHLHHNKVVFVCSNRLDWLSRRWPREVLNFYTNLLIFLDFAKGLRSLSWNIFNFSIGWIIKCLISAKPIV